MDAWIFSEMTSFCFRICAWLLPMPQFQEQIVVVAWFFVVEQLVDVPTRSWWCFFVLERMQQRTVEIVDVLVGMVGASGTHSQGTVAQRVVHRRVPQGRL